MDPRKPSTRRPGLVRRRWWPVLATVVAVLAALAVIVATRPFGSSSSTPPAGGSGASVTAQATSQPSSAAHEPRAAVASVTASSPVGFAAACQSPTGPVATVSIATGGDEEIGTESPATLFISSAPAGRGYLCLSTNDGHVHTFADPHPGVIGYLATYGPNIFGAVGPSVSRVSISWHLSAPPSGGWAVPTGPVDIDTRAASEDSGAVADGWHTFLAGNPEIISYDTLTAAAYDAAGNRLGTLTTDIQHH